MSNFNTMTEIAKAAREDGCNETLSDGFAMGEIRGHQVACVAVQVRTNGRIMTQMTWRIDGKRASRAKVAAL